MNGIHLVSRFCWKDDKYPGVESKLQEKHVRTMYDSPNPTIKKSAGKLIVPSLFFSQLATRPSGILTGFILIDVGLTFGCTVGVMGQIITVSSIIAMITALMMGAFSVRFKHRSLLISGLMLISSSAVGCYLAPNFMLMLAAFSLNGVGTVMVASMTMALVGEHLPVERRSSAIGWIIASTPMLSVITGLIISYITSKGWRLAYLWYVLPISLLSLVISVFGIPSSKHNPTIEESRGSYLEGFKKVFSNGSAISCLIGTTLAMAAWTGIVSYGISFFRQKFSMPTEWAGIIWSGMALCFTIGSLLSGRAVNKFGRKPVTLLSALLVGLFTISYANVPSLWSSIFLALLTSIFAGLRHSASNSLSLEQVPGYRGTMMSLSSGSIRFGSALGSGIGGMTLLWFNWGILGTVLGGMGLLGVLVYYLYTIDPIRQ